MKVKIKKWDMIATWKWYIPSGQDMCGICRSPFEATCAKCKFPGDGCPLSMLWHLELCVIGVLTLVVLGTCKHVFHMVNILRLLSSNASESNDYSALHLRLDQAGSLPRALPNVPPKSDHLYFALGN